MEHNSIYTDPVSANHNNHHLFFKIIICKAQREQSIDLKSKNKHRVRKIMKSIFLELEYYFTADPNSTSKGISGTLSSGTKFVLIKPS